ncbi:hypothetical protein OG379_40675 (plasmid) [Streptomyces sp. NBC_01166]|uniref:hypothetical protein n=1 Tax=Streptomyces sp. NBC_01166 TaxID=2903755 RepID=UPI002F911539|nr:hypothetical protein OG379_40675 [Streptomyces sp. NBC_01166]
MIVQWTATALEAGRFSATERCPDLADLAAHFDGLRVGGQGYPEVRLSDSEFPVLSLGFQDDQAVIHLFEDADRSALLVGDGTAAADFVVPAPFMGDLAEFSGGFVLAVDRAWNLLGDFIRAGSPATLGEWHEV